jgi:hypothetical protein
MADLQSARFNLAMTGVYPPPVVVQPKTCPKQEGEPRKVGVAGVVDRLDEGPGELDALIERADRNQSGIAGELSRRRLDHQRCAEKG